MDSLMLTILVVTFVNFLFALVRTYYTYKTYAGSKAYWDGWEERAKDIRKEAQTP